MSEKGRVNGVGFGVTASDPESTGSMLDVSNEPQGYAMGVLHRAIPSRLGSHQELQSQKLWRDRPFRKG